jgi:hypothetical protein
LRPKIDFGSFGYNKENTQVSNLKERGLFPKQGLLDAEIASCRSALLEKQVESCSTFTSALDFI